MRTARRRSSRPGNAGGRRSLLLLQTLAAAALTAAPALPPRAHADETADAAASGLALVNLDLLDSRDGYAIPADSRYFPGETVHLYFQIDGYRVSSDYRIDLEYRLQALDPGGKPFYGAEGGRFNAELAPQDEQWMPVVRYSPEIPEHAGGGAYRIEIEVRDRLADATVRAAVPIFVEGSRVEASDRLVVRNFGFSKAPGGPRLDKPLYRAGEEIWAEFHITGYKTREDNTFEVESDLRVLDDEGETLFVFDSRGETGSPFYPRLWLPAKFRLDLEKTIPRGRYTVVVNIRDKIGQAVFTERRVFEVY